MRAFLFLTYLSNLIDRTEACSTNMLITCNSTHVRTYALCVCVSLSLSLTHTRTHTLEHTHTHTFSHIRHRPFCYIYFSLLFMCHILFLILTHHMHVNMYITTSRQTDPIPLTWLLRMPRVSGLLFPDLGRLDTGRAMAEPGLMLTLRLSLDWPVWPRSSSMADRKQMVACSSLSPQPASRTFLSTSSTSSEHESIS